MADPDPDAGTNPTDSGDATDIVANSQVDDSEISWTQPAPAPAPARTSAPDSTPRLAPMVRQDVVSQGCSARLYLEPSLMVGLGSFQDVPEFVNRTSMRGALLHRVVLGAAIPLCSDDAATFRIRAGATALATNYDWAPDANKSEQMRYGAGLEVELDYKPEATSWVGLRLGLEMARAKYRTSSVPLMSTIGARIHIEDAMWLGVDVWHRSPSADETPLCNEVAADPCYGAITGVMAGVGVEGQKGAIAVAVEAFVGLIILGLLVGACAAGGC